MKPVRRKPPRVQGSCLYALIGLAAFAFLHALLMPQFGLLSVWRASRSEDHTLFGARVEQGGASSTPQEMAEMKRSLRDIQGLLADMVTKMPVPHNDSSSILSGGNTTDAALLDAGRCPIVRPPPTIGWDLRPEKYLMMFCMSGRMGNRLECIMNSMVAAAVLNRTMIFPSTEFDYDFDSLIDFPHFTDCFRKETVITLAAFRKKKAAQSKEVVIDRLACLPNRRNEDSIKIFKEKTGIRIVKQECNFEFHESSISLVLPNLAADLHYDDEVLAIGEGFGFNMGRVGLLTKTGTEPWMASCTLPVVRPHANILFAAQDFAQMFLGSRFLGVHLRRTDFLGYCNDPRNKCQFYPIPQVARCLEQQAKAANCSVVFLATDASNHEFDLLKEISSRSAWPLAYVRLPPQLSDFTGLDWAERLSPNQREYAEVRAALDRVITGMSATFIFSAQSTFSREVKRLRTAWQLTGCQDTSLCQNELGDELPNSIETRPLVTTYPAQTLDLKCVAKKTEKTGFKCWKVKQRR